jgi:predicted alpha/beta superfamily hydrolase
MHDGLGTFTQWRLDETITALVLNKQMEPIILVCVPNGGTHADRFEEYTPTKDPQEKAGGHADEYGRMLIEEIKPLIDAEYRTLDGPQNTALGGVSLGGLATLYLGLKYPQVYGKLAVMSPSLWWDNRMIFSRVKSLTAKPPLRIWLDVGTAEGSLNSVKELRDVLKRKGWVLEADLRYYEAKDARHLEEDFARRAALVMKFLFPPVSQNSDLH